ncbi:MAG: DUF6477 family protein [Pseudomonadota bacterium]
MPDLLTQLNALKRPRLLINAARLGLSDYRRGTHLARHLGNDMPANGEAVLRQLMAIEHDLDQERRMQAASYSVARHVEIMIAMMCEARLLRLGPEQASRDPALSGRKADPSVSA